MRSQATKPLPKKGALGKTSFKASSAAKELKKKTAASKKAKPPQKSSIKGSKKKSGDDITANKNEDCPVKDKNESSTSEVSKMELPKPSASKEDSAAKTSKKDRKETKDKAKVLTKKVVAKKSIKVTKKSKSNQKSNKEDNEDIKYKLNLDAVKKVSAKSPKTTIKSNVKKGNLQNQKKTISNASKETEQFRRDKTNSEEEKDNNSVQNQHGFDKTDPKDIKKNELQSEIIGLKVDTQYEKTESSNQLNKTTPQNFTDVNAPTETPKTETERPPKFFTSSRSPRTVDIDVKCCKNSKGNLSVSERFLSTKTDDNNKEKNSTNNLVSQGSEIDVYTFTEKVDSPKSILSDFRSPVNKNVGRVRPIARVKGTVIDKKADTERKKYSPHRPIEEVVKQLKANKRSEDLNTNQNSTNYVSSGLDFGAFTEENEVEDTPPIVSKSYKMVARKSSITGKPFSPIKFLDQESSPKTEAKPPTKSGSTKKNVNKKKQSKKGCLSDEEIDTSTFSLNTKVSYTSSEESVSESNDDNESKESSGSDSSKCKKVKAKKYKKITDGAKKCTSKELKELSKDSLIDLKDTSALLGNEKPSKRRLKLLSMWNGPKKHRMASLNALAKVHCLYENESRTHMELGLMKTIDRQVLPSTSKASAPKKKDNKSKEVEKQESSSTSESEYENKTEKDKESSESSDENPPQRTLRGVPGIRSAGKYWDPKSSTSSSEDSELESRPKNSSIDKKKTAQKTTSAAKSDSDKSPPKMKKTTGVPVKKKRNRNEVVMDLKDMVVQKRMASLNATAILAASYEKRSPKSSKEDTTSDSCSDESFSQKPKNVISSGVKSELKIEDTKKENDETTMTDRKQKVEVIVNQDTDVTITGVYSTHHHEGFCTVSGMQYRISSTSHTQTTATANCEKEGCSREDGSRYTPLSALSSMQPPAEHAHNHPHPVPELGGLARRAAGCSSAFSAPSPAAHHDPGYYQPAGPLIKETSADAERALARYHPPPHHYHAPHPPVPQYGPPYYQAELCYGRYYRPPGPYHMGPPQPDAQMVSVAGDPYPPPQYYGTPPCYQHSPQRIPYVEYRGCPCPLNACPKNVHIGPATGKAPAGGGPDVPPALAPPGAAFRAKVRAAALDHAADTHGSGKDPPLEPEPPEPPTAADAPHPCPLPTIGGASPKREIFDVRDNIRMNADIPGPEAVGPPSPARGACAPQPPQRRARLGKAMARRSLAGDDTGLLLSPQQPVVINDTDDDVLAISPPVCAPIDLSSSDERSTPLVDVKKENEGPTYATARKPDTQALREHNCTTALTEAVDATESAKAVKRRYSKPKLEIEMKDVQLEDSCKTNGIGEHVKLQKRRKVSGEHTHAPRVETVTKESKKKTNSSKKTPKTSTGDKKAHKRKTDTALSEPKAKKALIEPGNSEDPRHINIAAVTDDPRCKKPKTKSALLLDNLLKKNSIDRPDAKGYVSDTKLNPAELFLSPNENVSQIKKTLNINNNIVENNVPVNGVRPKTIAAVSQLIGKKLAYKNACKIDKIDSKVTHSIKSVLPTPTETLNIKEDTNHTTLLKSVTKNEKNIPLCSENDRKRLDIDEKVEIKDSIMSLLENKTEVDNSKPVRTSKCTKSIIQASSLETSSEKEKNDIISESHDKVEKSLDLEECKVTRNAFIGETITDSALEKPVTKRCKATTEKVNGEFKSKNVEKLVKLLASKKQVNTTSVEIETMDKDDKKDLDDQDKNKEVITTKRCKLTSEKPNNEKSKADKVVKLLVSKKTVIKTDEASLVVEDACSSPVLNVRKNKRRRSGGRRVRRIPTTPLAPPDVQLKAPPRWSNGWTWDGDHYLSKVYLNNDSRLDRTARCWPRMSHASGDRVARGDCVLLRASQARAQPFVARIASLWENPDDGEMMVSLVWYYRPEHTELGRQAADAPDEVFASRHRDANSVACIEDKCYVLTFNEYCRYKKRLKAAEEGIAIAPSAVPALPAGDAPAALPPAVSPELVLFCRKIYDFRSKKIQVPNK